MFDRRDLMKGFFSGVVLSGLGSTGLVKTFAPVIYHKHDHYTGPRGHYNIWFVADKKWHLLSDFQKTPFEFRSKEDAQKYIMKAGLKVYDSYVAYDSGIDRNGLVAIRKCPFGIADFKYCRLSDYDAMYLAESIIQSSNANPAIRPYLEDILKAEDGGQQADLWNGVLENKEFGKEFKKLEKNKLLDEIIRSVYYGNESGTHYHCELAKLNTFYPPLRTRVI